MSAEILAQAEEFGIKRICQSCSIKYYDLNKSPIVCPACGTEFDPEAILSRRRSRIADEAKPKVENDIEDVEDKDEDEEESDETLELETEEDVAADIPDVEDEDDSEFGEQVDDATLLEEDDDDSPLLPEVVISSDDDDSSN